MGRVRRAGRPRGTVAAWSLACVAATGAGVVAGWQLLGPSPVPAEDGATRLTYRVQDGSVGRTASYTAHASREQVPLGVASGSGVVTGHGPRPGEVVESGTVLLRVDERPVVVLDGEVPSYRDLALGDTGEDVRQLQLHLRAAGLLTAAADGDLGPSTVRAVRSWQRSLGVPPDGVVRAGDVVFTPALPAHVELDEAVGVGVPIRPGAPLGTAWAGDPEIALVAEDGQRRLPEPGDQVVVVLGDARWPAVTGPAVTDATGRVTVPLHAPDGGAVCGAQCAAVPSSTGVAVLTAEVVVVPEARGPVVPVAALRTDPGGEVSVALDTGAEVVVRVLADDGGRAVVEGVVAGQVLVLFEGGRP